MQPKGEQSPKFLDRLLGFDLARVNIMVLAHVARLTAEPDFNVVQVRVCSCLHAGARCALTAQSSARQRCIAAPSN